MPTYHQNPAWTHDELVVVLDLYLRRGPHAPNGEFDPELIEVSRVLNGLDIIADSDRADKFRSPVSVEMKMRNFNALNPDFEGVGLTRGVSAETQRVWDLYHDRPEALAVLAQEIRERSRPQRTPAAADNTPGVPAKIIPIRTRALATRMRAMAAELVTAADELERG
jgi:hypothetical protein